MGGCRPGSRSDELSDPGGGVSLMAAPSSARYDVFLSHSKVDKPRVEELARRLKQAGIEPFLDKWNLVPGDPWQEALEAALSTAPPAPSLLEQGASAPGRTKSCGPRLSTASAAAGVGTGSSRSCCRGHRSQTRRDYPASCCAERGSYFRGRSTTSRRSTLWSAAFRARRRAGTRPGHLRGRMSLSRPGSVRGEARPVLLRPRGAG